MSIADRLPAPGRGRWLTSAAPAAAWVAAYWVNGWLRDRFLDHALGMARTGPAGRDDPLLSPGNWGSPHIERYGGPLPAKSRSSQAGGRYEY